MIPLLCAWLLLPLLLIAGCACAVAWSLRRQDVLLWPAVLASIVSVVVAGAIMVWLWSLSACALFMFAPAVAVAGGVLAFAPAWALSSSVVWAATQRHGWMRLLGFGLLLLFLSGGLFAAMNRALKLAAEKDRRIDCISNLKSIGLAMHIYAADHRETFPPLLSDLSPEYISDPDLFVCRSSTARPGLMTNVHSWCRYVFVSGLSESDPPGMAQVLEDPANHGGAGGNVCYVGGFVKWLNRDELLRLLEEPWSEAGCSPEVIAQLKQRIRIIRPGQPPDAWSVAP